MSHPPKPFKSPTLFAHIRNYIFRGLLTLIPIVLCVLVVHLMYVLIDQKVISFLEKFFEVRRIPGLGILLVLLFLYLIGLIASNIIGHQLFKYIGHVTEQIPVLKFIYGIGKQLSQSLSVAEEDKQAFQKAVLVKINGMLVVAFVTNTLVDKVTNEKYIVVLLPTSPTPASGFVVAVPAAEVIDPGWTIEEALKMVVSVGIISPKEISRHLAP